MADSFASLSAKLNTLGKALAGANMKAVMQRVGEAAQKRTDAAATGDLGGDRRFSGWKPVLETKVVHLEEGVVQIRPTKHSAGPWTVAERGRNQGGHSGFAGPGVNRSTGATARTKSGGLRKVRSSGGRRWNGRTAGKSTASKAVAAIEKETPKMIEDATRDAIVKAALG